MSGPQSISRRQFEILVLLFSLGDAVLVLPTVLAQEARQDAWIASGISFVIGLGFVFLYYAVAKRFPGKSLIEACETAFGRWTGTAASLLYLSFLFLLSSILLRETGDFLTVLVLPETPIEAIHLLFAGVVVWGTKLGLETIARSAEIFFPWVLLMLSSGVVFIVSELKLENVHPILEYGISPVLRGTYAGVAIPFMELSAFLMIMPFVRNRRSLRKAFLIGAGVGGFALFLVILWCILALGPDMTARQQFPTFALARKINVGNWLQRMEIVLAGTWFITMFFKLAICFAAFCAGTAQLLRMPDLRSPAIPLGFLLLATALIISPNIVYFTDAAVRYWPPFAFVCGIALPASLLVAGALRPRS